MSKRLLQREFRLLRSVTWQVQWQLSHGREVTEFMIACACGIGACLSKASSGPCPRSARPGSTCQRLPNSVKDTFFRHLLRRQTFSQSTELIVEPNRRSCLSSDFRLKVQASSHSIATPARSSGFGCGSPCPDSRMRSFCMSIAATSFMCTAGKLQAEPSTQW